MCSCGGEDGAFSSSFVHYYFVCFASSLGCSIGGGDGFQQGDGGAAGPFWQKKAKMTRGGTLEGKRRSSRRRQKGSQSVPFRPIDNKVGGRGGMNSLCDVVLNIAEDCNCTSTQQQQHPSTSLPIHPSQIKSILLSTFSTGLPFALSFIWLNS
jgi:hypothetical protein